MKILKDSLWANGSALLTQVIALITTLIVARFVGPHEYGLVATGLVILLFFQRFLLESFGFAVIRETEKHEGYVESANYCSIRFGYLSSILMLVIALILYSFSYTELAVVLVALSLIPILDGYGTIRTCILRRDGKFKQLAGRVLIANSLAGSFSIVLAINNFGIWALIIQQIVLAICNLIIAYKYADWVPIEKVNEDSIKKIMKFGLPMMSNSIVFVSANRVDILFLNFFSTSYSVGIYSIARRITRTIPDILLNGSNSVLMTHLRGKGREDAIKIINEKIKYIMLLTAPFLVYLFCFSAPLVDIVFGEKWNNSDMDKIIKILCILCFFQIITSLLNTMLINLNLTKKVAFNNSIQLISFIILLLLSLLLNNINALTVSFLFVVSYLFSMINLFFIIYKKDLYNLFEFFKKILIVFPMSGLIYYFFNFKYSENLIFNMFLSFFYGFIAYVVVLIFIDKKTRLLFKFVKEKLCRE